MGMSAASEPLNYFIIVIYDLYIDDLLIVFSSLPWKIATLTTSRIYFMMLLKAAYSVTMNIFQKKIFSF